VEAGQAIAEQQGQRLWAAWLWHRAARLKLADADPDANEIRGLGRRAIMLFGGMNHRYGKAHCRLVMGQACLVTGRREEAVPLLEEAMENFLNCGDRWAEAECARLVALARFPEGTDPEALRLLRMARRMFEDLGDAQRAKEVQEELNRRVAAAQGAALAVA